MLLLEALRLSFVREREHELLTRRSETASRAVHRLSARRPAWRPPTPPEWGSSRDAHGSASVYVFGAAKWLTSACAPAMHAPAAIAAIAAERASTTRSAAAANASAAAIRNAFAKASRAAATKVSSMRWNITSKRAYAPFALTDVRALRRVGPNARERAARVHRRRRASERGRSSRAGRSERRGPRRRSGASPARSRKSRSWWDDGRERDKGERDAEVPDREVQRARRGHPSIRKQLLDQRRQREISHPEPGDELGHDEPRDVVRRHERERSDAAADEPAADGHSGRGVTARLERRRARRRGRCLTASAADERMHCPPDDEQEHDAEEERGQRPRPRARARRACGRRRERFTARPPARELNQVLRSAAATSGTGACATKIARHENACVKAPPTTGPTASAQHADERPRARRIARRPPRRPPRGSPLPRAPWTARATSRTLEAVGERAGDAREREGAERDRRQRARPTEARVEPRSGRAPCRRAQRCTRRAPPRRRRPSCAGRRGGSAARA